MFSHLNPKYPQYGHTNTLNMATMIELGQICDATIVAYQRNPNAVTLSCTSQDNVYEHFRPSFMLSSISIKNKLFQ